MTDYTGARRGSHDPGGGAGGSGGTATAGKRTLTQGLERPPGGSDGGSPVAGGIRGQVERVTGADLGGVRVHTGPDASQAAHDMGAQAFTYGQDIHFAAGRYDPGSTAGDNLIAHELAHTIQQRGASDEPQARLEVSSPGDSAEREADHVADLATAPAAGCQCDGACACAAGATATAAPSATVRNTVSRRLVQRRTEGETGAAAAAGDASLGAAAGAGAAAAAAAAGAGAAAGAAAGACDPAEQARADAFRTRTDLQVLDNIPSPGTGKFDAQYYPAIGLMPVTVKIHFDFVEADNTPGLGGLIGRMLGGQSNAQFFWTDAEKADFRTQFVARCLTAWSAKHVLRSTKPCWTFTAIPIVSPIPHADKASAHYAITVHKSSGPGIDYKSGLSRVQLTDPTAQPTGNLWQSDVQESGNFNSVSVATQERQRLERELATAAATPVLFGHDQDVVDGAATTALTTFAGSLNKANPSAPLIPIDIVATASAEGDPTRNQDLSDRRARNVAAVLTGAGVRQPVRPVGNGPVGAPNDAANRKADISIDHVFETAYASNRYAVGEHEFGHMLGNLDEYQNQTTGTTGARQTQYGALITSAGLDQPTWASNTSSIMSAGVDVLPRHYVTLWEALGRMTTPDITQAEWSFH